MRADAQQNRDHLLAVAREVMYDQGVDASLRDIARRAGVGLGTLYRHFPTRESLLESLLRCSFDGLTRQAAFLQQASSPAEALTSWLESVIEVAQRPRGMVATMAAAIADEDSALHASCVAMKAAGATLLARAQDAGTARLDMDGTDLFALVGALTWVYDQPLLTSRAANLFRLITGSIVQTAADGCSGNVLQKPQGKAKKTKKGR